MYREQCSVVILNIQFIGISSIVMFQKGVDELKYISKSKNSLHLESTYNELSCLLLNNKFDPRMIKDQVAILGAL